ncbi:hypothetical protein QFZ31_005230 [Neobacillus niacini]|uniref:aldolase n=1 Tax=Neobacillus driksii TaxID=3035913 RepID=UPI00278653A5|nr:aldolase [Neobacillus niacini]MDQ0975352.1 hypothetical protein [Neobacillus niacini]
MATKTIKGTIYRAFGLSILSEIPLPEVMDLSEQNGDIDVYIKLDISLPTLWDSLQNEKRKLIVYENLVLFEVPQTAIFGIKDGKNILVCPLKEADFDKIRLYILGTCIGVLLMQRKILPLHGSAVVINNKAYAIIGKSGAGKSTLATAFIKNGYQLLSDDVIAVGFEEGDIPYVMPSYPQQKLWSESMSIFGMETSNYSPLFERETKFSVPIINDFYSNPLPLSGIFELIKTEERNINFRKIEGLERVQTVLRQTFRGSLLNQMGLTGWHFNISLNLINKTPIYQLQRPSKGFTASELLSIILGQINSEGINS